MPTLNCRPLLIASQLEPLFASLGQLLGGRAGSAAAARVAASVSASLSVSASASASVSVSVAVPPDDTAGARSGPVASTPPAAPSDAEWQAVRGPVLQQLRAVVGLDSRAGMNRALAHGFLFRCWLEVRALAAAAHYQEDDLVPRAEWQLSTGASSCIRT